MFPAACIDPEQPKGTSADDVEAVLAAWRNGAEQCRRGLRSCWALFFLCAPGSAKAAAWLATYCAPNIRNRCSPACVRDKAQPPCSLTHTRTWWNALTHGPIRVSLTKLSSLDACSPSPKPSPDDERAASPSLCVCAGMHSTLLYSFECTDNLMLMFCCSTASAKTNKKKPSRPNSTVLHGLGLTGSINNTSLQTR